MVREYILTWEPQDTSLIFGKRNSARSSNQSQNIHRTLILQIRNSTCISSAQTGKMAAVCPRSAIWTRSTINIIRDTATVYLSGSYLHKCCKHGRGCWTRMKSASVSIETALQTTSNSDSANTFRPFIPCFPRSPYMRPNRLLSSVMISRIARGIHAINLLAGDRTFIWKV